MKVLLINGSPRQNGNTATALGEVAAQLKKNGIESEIAWTLGFREFFDGIAEHGAGHLAVTGQKIHLQLLKVRCLPARLHHRACNGYLDNMEA